MYTGLPLECHWLTQYTLGYSWGQHGAYLGPVRWAPSWPMSLVITGILLTYSSQPPAHNWQVQAKHDFKYCIFHSDIIVNIASRRTDWYRIILAALVTLALKWAPKNVFSLVQLLLLAYSYQSYCYRCNSSLYILVLCTGIHIPLYKLHSGVIHMLSEITLGLRLLDSPINHYWLRQPRAMKRYIRSVKDNK